MKYLLAQRVIGVLLIEVFVAKCPLEDFAYIIIL